MILNKQLFMKQNDITDINIEKLTAQNFENVLNVYQNEDSSYYYNLLKTVNFPEELDPTYYYEYTTVPGDTWPLIAYKSYKNVKLWWVVCSCNNVINPVAQPEPGTILKILYNNVVREILGQLKTS